ncbi:MAG: hypothetical protein JOZ57_13030 [Abitibacteriaceae bacterium]|nr:hypothetical protein [Abditibacteriaceae bacterium]
MSIELNKSFGVVQSSNSKKIELVFESDSYFEAAMCLDECCLTSSAKCDYKLISKNAFKGDLSHSTPNQHDSTPGA